jgi:hypothetical protein
VERAQSQVSGTKLDGGGSQDRHEKHSSRERATAVECNNRSNRDYRSVIGAVMRLKREAEKNAEVLFVKTDELIAQQNELRQALFRN